MKNNVIKPSILPGFLELLPKEQQVFNDMAKKITEVYEKNGCMNIDTPIIEKSEILLVKTGGETQKQVYRFTRGKNDLALRFDLTVPLARYVAQNYNDLTFPFKRYQIGKAYRGERNQRGRYREFYQCDVDVIGKNTLSIKNDGWIISLASKAFKSIGLTGYKFQISNRKILKSIIDELEIKNSLEVMMLIDKYDKIGKIQFENRMEKIVGAYQCKYISNVLDIQGTKDEVIEQLDKLNIKNPLFIQGIKELKEVKSMLEMLGVGTEEFEINLKIIRGLDYYTGTVFETMLMGNEEFGSICSGGRYDNLAQNYTENLLPGVGISIGLTRLFFILKEIGFVDKYQIKGGLDYLIIPIGNTLEYCIKVMKCLGEKGYGATIYFEDDTLKKKMNYGNKIGAENVVLVGEEEVAKKEIKIKNMKNGSTINLKVG